MPRISPKLARLARQNSPLLPPLLRATRTLESAKNELRWIQNELPQHQWSSAIARRARMEPLQYILGSQPFGSLEIGCEPGVLIPRWETEEWVHKLIDILRPLRPLTVVDACTGTGCIPLLIKHELPKWHVSAFDVSDQALSLAKRNCLRLDVHVDVHYGDVFDKETEKRCGEVDLITANPPYIPLEDYRKPVLLDGPEKSVRLFEPQLALVGHLEFYTALVGLVRALNCKGFVFELGYEQQVEATAALLPKGWEMGSYYDLAGRLRCVVGWRKDSELALLRQLVQDRIYELNRCWAT